MLKMTGPERALASAVPVDDVATARGVWSQYRADHGAGSGAPLLLTAPDHQPKTGKNDVPTYLLHLAPERVAGVGNVCPMSTAGCRAGCLNTAGRGIMSTVQRGRILKTGFMVAHPAEFLTLLRHEIVGAVRRHGAVGVRLNGTSDIRWELAAPWLFDIDGVTFYDYTKIPDRSTPANYHLTYSVSERDRDGRTIGERARAYGRVAVVVDTPAGPVKRPLPLRWSGLPVVDGDETDWRLETGGVAVLLRAKGAIRHETGDRAGFVKPTGGV